MNKLYRFLVSWYITIMEKSCSTDGIIYKMLMSFKIYKHLIFQLCMISNLSTGMSNIFCVDFKGTLTWCHLSHLINWHIEVWKNGRNFAGDIFKCIFLNEYLCMFIQISLKFVPENLINSKSALLGNGLVPFRWQAISWTKLTQLYDTIWHH